MRCDFPTLPTRTVIVLVLFGYPATPCTIEPDARSTECRQKAIMRRHALQLELSLIDAAIQKLTRTARSSFPLDGAGRL